MKYFYLLVVILCISLIYQLNISINSCKKDINWAKASCERKYNPTLFKDLSANECELRKKSIPKYEQQYAYLTGISTKINWILFAFLCFFCLSFYFKVKNYLLESIKLFIFAFGILSLIFFHYYLAKKLHFNDYNSSSYPFLCFQFLSIFPIFLSKYFSNKYLHETSKGRTWNYIIKVIFILTLCFLLTVGLIEVLFLCFEWWPHYNY